jgi:hypothetical protein
MAEADIRFRNTYHPLALPVTSSSTNSLQGEGQTTLALESGVEENRK